MKTEAIRRQRTPKSAGKRLKHRLAPRSAPAKCKKPELPTGGGDAHARISPDANNQSAPPKNCDQKKSDARGSDLRQYATEILASRGCKVNEDTIKIVVDRIRARKEEGARRKQGGIRANFTAADVDREDREQQELLKEAGLLDEISGAEAAFDDLTDVELCRDLAGNFARESAGKTGDARGDVRDRYETITTELRCVRATQLRDALAEEYARDRKGLLRFLDAVFKRWRKIDQPQSAWRAKLVIEQHANDVPHHRIAQRLEKIDAVQKGSAVPGTSTYRKLRSKIKQIRCRDSKAALKRRAGDKNG